MDANGTGAEQVGAALGALLPSSEREQDWVDAARGELWEKAEQIGREAAIGCAVWPNSKPARQIVDC
jgi:hypothetical protein